MANIRITLTFKIQNSNLLNRGSSSVDRALAFQAKGREFESRLPLKKVIRNGRFFCLITIRFINSHFSRA